MSMVLAHPLSPAAHGDPPDSGTGRRRWEVWRSPAGQPPWARPVLLGIAALAALLYAWNITDAGLAPFYSVAVKSMSESWKAFFYGAFDPRATITIDKLAGSFLPQALSARIFGFHPWSLALPQVIEGIVSVLALYRAVRRWAGVTPGLLAAALFALTPIAASMFGHSMEDGALTMCLVLAADAYQRAVTEARLRSLIWAGAWVGLGFQAKMLQAWMILPALGIGYLLAAPTRLRRRVWQLGAAGVVMLAVSLSWIALYTFTPARDRPYVDGSTTNSAAAMVFGYNGLERFGITIAGAVSSGPGVTSSGGSRTGGAAGGGRPAVTLPGGRSGTGGRSGPAGTGQATGNGLPGGTGPGQAGPGQTGPGGTAPGGTAPGQTAPGQTAPGGTGRTFTGSPGDARLTAGSAFGQGWTKLLGSSYGPQIGWLYPLAALALIFGLLWTFRDKRAGQIRAGFVMWGIWLLTFGLIFSRMSTIPHTAYMASLAPPLAALSAAGLVMFWRYYRAGDPRGWLLPVAVAAEVAWAVFLWRDYGGFLPWVPIAAVVAGAVAIVAMVLARLTGRVRTRLATAGLTAGVVAALAAPSAWAASVLDPSYAGSSFNASAGPAGGLGGGANTPGPGVAAAGGMLGATTTLSASERRLYDYLTAHRDGASYLMAVSSWSEASPYILSTGQEVMPMGGFSGTIPEPTLNRVRELVSSGQLRFFLLGAGGSGLGRGGGRGPAARSVTSWVESSCRTVPAGDYGGTTGAAAGGTLYACQASS